MLKSKITSIIAIVNINTSHFKKGNNIFIMSNFKEVNTKTLIDIKNLFQIDEREEKIQMNINRVFTGYAINKPIILNHINNSFSKIDSIIQDIDTLNINILNILVDKIIKNPSNLEHKNLYLIHQETSYKLYLDIIKHLENINSKLAELDTENNNDNKVTESVCLYKGPGESVDYSSYGLNTAEMRNKINKILDREIGLDVKPTFTNEDNKFIIKVKDIDYSSITDNKKLNLENKIQDEVHKYLHKQYSIHKCHDYLVDKNRINIVAFSGSTYIVVQILSKKYKNSLSNTEKDMLEFYNFMNIIKKDIVPVRESDYLQHHYTF